MACTLQQMIGSNIRKLRKARGFTQEVLAGMLDMDRCHLQDIEAGVSEVGSNRLLGICAALGAANGDVNFAAQVEWTLASLDKLADNVLEETGTRIGALATANLVALADYGITQAEVDALAAQRGEFHDTKTAPREAVAGRAGETKTLPEKITGVTSLLRNCLDKLMTRFKRTEPEFYQSYLSARVIVDRGGAQAAPKPTPAPQPQT